MNNKGFAITSIIYGLMLLFVVVVTSFLAILVGRNRRMNQLIEDIYSDVKYEAIVVSPDEFNNENNSYVTKEKGLYYFQSNGCYVFLPKNISLVLGSFKEPNNADKKDKVYYYEGGSFSLDDYKDISDMCVK